MTAPPITRDVTTAPVPRGTQVVQRAKAKGDRREPACCLPRSGKGKRGALRAGTGHRLPTGSCQSLGHVPAKGQREFSLCARNCRRKGRGQPAFLDALSLSLVRRWLHLAATAHE